MVTVRHDVVEYILEACGLRVRVVFAADGRSKRISFTLGDLIQVRQFSSPLRSAPEAC